VPLCPPPSPTPMQLTANVKKHMQKHLKPCTELSSSRSTNLRRDLRGYGVYARGVPQFLELRMPYVRAPVIKKKEERRKNGSPHFQSINQFIYLQQMLTGREVFSDKRHNGEETQEHKMRMMMMMMMMNEFALTWRESEDCKDT